MSGDDPVHEHQVYFIPTAVLDHCLKFSNTYWGGSYTASVYLWNGRHYWTILPYSNGTTTTALKYFDENSIIHSIWGVK